MVVAMNKTTVRPVLLMAAATGEPLAAKLGARMVSCGLRVSSVPLAPHATDARCEMELAAAAAPLESPFVLGGFSLGARIATQLCAAGHGSTGRPWAPKGLLLFGYPFHPHGDPGSRPGLEALRRVHLPIHVVQGSRDSHGSMADVRGYALPEAVSITWLHDGNHRFVPRRKSGSTTDSLLTEAALAACAFVRSCTARAMHA